MFGASRGIVRAADEERLAVFAEGEFRRAFRGVNVVEYFLRQFVIGMRLEPEIARVGDGVFDEFLRVSWFDLSHSHREAVDEIVEELSRLQHRKRVLHTETVSVNQEDSRRYLLTGAPADHDVTETLVKYFIRDVALVNWRARRQFESQTGDCAMP